MIRVLLAEDNRLVQKAVRDFLDLDADLEIVDVVVDGRDAVDAALRLHPDVLLMDVTMPRLDGVGATRELTEAGFGGSVLMLASRTERDDLAASLDAGAVGYLFKDEDPVAFRRALRMAITNVGRTDRRATRGIEPEHAAGSS